MILQNILNRIGNPIRNSIVVEDDGVCIFVKRERLCHRRLIRHMTSNGWRVLGNLLAFGECGIGDDLVRKDLGCRARLVVVHCIADCVLGPVRIKRDVFRYRQVPVIRRASFISLGKPALEGVVLLRRIGRRFRIEAVLLCFRSYCRATLRVIRHCTGRELEVAVEHKACRHLGCARVRKRILVLGISKPTEPGRTLHRRIGNIAFKVVVDIGVQRN